MEEIYKESLVMWEQGYYEAALDIWKICLEKREYINEIVTSIQEAFLKPNEKEFVCTLQKNWDILLQQSLTYEESQQKYRSFTIRYLCYDEGKYYIFDADHNLLLEKMNLLENSGISNEFDDILIIYPQSIIDITTKFCKKYKKNIYCLGEKKQEFDSVYCIPELADILEKGIVYFKNCEEEKEYFLKNKSEYIPKNIVGYGDKAIVNEILQNFEEVHKKRLEKEYRDSSNVLLSIGIPTYCRGKRALQNVQHILPSLYDAEIEIVVSDNGSEIQTEEYKQIADMNDSRIKYYRAPQNKGFIGNIQKIFEIASGKFVLFISDEDLVVIESLNHYLAILRNHRDLGILRGSRTGKDNADNKVVYNPFYGRKCDEAIGHIFLYNNYLSGSIYACNDEVRCLFQEICMRYKNEQAFLHYPHMYLDAKIAEKYDVCDDKEYLIYIGESEMKNVGLLEYAKLENRIQQHIGWRKLLEDLDMVSVNTRYALYVDACEKLFRLVFLVKKYYIDEWESVCKQIVEICAIEFDNICFLNEEQKNNIRQDFVEIICNMYNHYLNNDWLLQQL